MAERRIIPANVPATYAELRRAVEATLVLGQQEVEQAQVRTYWETGRLIHEHVLLFKERADYGSGTIQQLAADLQRHRSVLQRCVQFYLAFPNCATWRNLGWAHFCVLIPVADARQREALAAEADRNEWPVIRLIKRIRQLTLTEETPAAALMTTGEAVKRLSPRSGTPGLHPIVDRGDGPVMDLGFKLYHALAPTTKLTAGDIVRFATDGSVRRVEGATKAELFTYAATLRRVVDGDTLVVALEIAPGIFIEQKLRLRGLDCPELSTPEGKAAKRFVDTLIAQTTAVTINTTKPDKYDRYLADVFLELDPSRPSVASAKEGQLAEGPLFLNNALLETGYAERKDAWEFGDWGR